MQQPAARKITAWNILFFVLGLALLAGLLTQVDFRALWSQVASISLPYYLLAWFFYLLKTSLRALRFQRLNRHSQPSFVDMLRLVLASSFAVQLLPLKMGEFAYVYLLKRSRRASIPQGVSSLIAVRLFDLLAIPLLFILISVVLGFPSIDRLAVYFNAILVFIAILLGLVLAILIGSRFAGPALERIFGLALLQRVAVTKKLQTGLNSLMSALASYTARDMLGWSLLASLEWFCNYLSFHVLLLGIGLAPNFYTTVVAVTFAALASALPLNTLGSFGTQEAGWAAGIFLMGYPRDIAISSGFATHLLTVSFMLVLGGLAWLSYLLPARPLVGHE